MTNEEAIIYLERADTTVYKEIKTKTAEALEIAIKALEQTDKIEESNFSTEQYKADLQGAYDCGYAKALEQQPRWIPVTERLPELGDVVLIYDKVFGYLTAIYSEVVDDYNERIPCFSTHYSISSDKWAILHPIKWMPFEPYNAESENRE